MLFEPVTKALTEPVVSTQWSQVQKSCPHPSQNAHLHALAVEIFHNLQYQHNWSGLCMHNISPVTSAPFPRPLISGVPPHRIYVHPDDQIEEIKYGLKEEDVEVDREWVLPTRLREKWSLSRFGDVFDAIDVEPQAPGEGNQNVRGSKEIQEEVKNEVGEKRNKHPRREKRLLLATAADDSTVVYYIVHDGIVKPRQN